MRRDAALTLRRARPQEAPELERVAQLDSTRVPDGEVLVAAVDGEILAWIELESGRTAADPFHLTLDLVRLLELRAAQLQPPERRSRRPAVLGLLGARRGPRQAAPRSLVSAGRDASSRSGA